jgi:hypothetical protein
MLDLSAYRLGFAPVLAALVVLAFSLEGVPDPLEPSVGTIEFDAPSALVSARGIVRAAPERAPGSDGAAAAADIVSERLEEVASGEVAEQRFEASVDGDDVELRNVLLTLPGTSDRTIVLVAERSAQAGTGAVTSAAATGMLLELAAQAGVSSRESTLIFASIDGAGAESEGIRELVGALPERTVVDAAIVISQPGAAPAEPHLVTSSGGSNQPSQTLIRTAEETLESRAQAAAGVDGALGQLARLALPAAAGTQAALLDEGIDAVAISAAGEVPLPPDATGWEALDAESVEGFGATALALVSALDVAPAAADEDPGEYIRLGDNTVPGWAIALLALALLAPPALPVALQLARARGAGEARGSAGWAAEWALVGLTPLLALYALALVGALPKPEVPYDPGRFELGLTEVLALLVFAAATAGAWWALGLRRVPAGPEPATLGAAAGAVVIVACLVAWIANPFLALVLVPLAHVVIVHALDGRRRATLAVAAGAVACVPAAAVLLHVAGALEWGSSAPWQLVVLVAGGGIGLLAAGAVTLALAGLGGVIRAGLRAAPQARPRGRP